ncbi:hypothetical protein BQ8482_280114 [Mesorhizobium delmotii]|uniref:Uncharacterized protein n=1 Tax=Mesorhizobium delmotii TaxID=1631247 RepID=A0A2P9AML1_9HYPH|nr:hypothetical protein BQ8482_280114 [Mesorhizobium delmotii]
MQEALHQPRPRLTGPPDENQLAYGRRYHERRSSPDDQYLRSVLASVTAPHLLARVCAARRPRRQFSVAGGRRCRSTAGLAPLRPKEARAQPDK